MGQKWYPQSSDPSNNFPRRVSTQAGNVGGNRELARRPFGVLKYPRKSSPHSIFYKPTIT